MFKKFFKKKKKENTIPLEEQLKKLENLGITLNSNVTIGNLLFEMNRKDLESKPYLFLLMALGGEFETSDNVWLHISDNIWYLDTECIEDNGDYVRIIERLIVLSQGILKIKNLTDFVDIDNKKANVSFELNGEYYNWSMEVNDDWLDINILYKLNTVLSKLNTEKRFFTAVIDQSCLIGFFTQSQAEELNKLCDIIKFENI